MVELLGAEQNMPFTVALVVMFAIAALEGVGTLMGMGVSSFVDSLVPDIDLDIDADVDLDVDADVDLDADVVQLPSALTNVLGWLRIGQVPILVLLVIFLTAFGLLGLVGQSFLNGSLGFMLPASVAWLPVLLAALPIVRMVGGWVARVMPKEETSAVSRETFVGRVATIALGCAKSGEPAQARLRDEHGRTHYVMVEPDLEGESFDAGQPVLLVRSDGPRFRVIRPPSTALMEDEDER